MERSDDGYVEDHDEMTSIINHDAIESSPQSSQSSSSFSSTSQLSSVSSAAAASSSQDQIDIAEISDVPHAEVNVKSGSIGREPVLLLLKKK